jgi:hypothetical protein
VSVLVSIQPGSRGVLASENEDHLTKGKTKKIFKTKVDAFVDSICCD